MDSGAQSAARHTTWTRVDSVSRMGKAAGKIIGRIRPTGTIKGNVEIWRAAWAAYTNRALESAGRPGRIDHRSYKRQGIDKIPSVHLGPAASQMEKRGIRTDKGEVNRQIAADNKLLKRNQSPHYPSLSLVERRSGKTTNAAKQLDRLVGSPAAVERSPHPHRQNPGFAGKRCTIQLFAGKRHPVYAAAS